jgi:hypothetical protein
MKTTPVKLVHCLLLVLLSAPVIRVVGQDSKEEVQSNRYLFNDAHFHLTNYIQEGTDIKVYLNEIMGDKVGRSVMFGLPLQQQWSYQNSGSFAPTYYLQTDAPLYYYSFTDAYFAMQYKSLTPEQQKRFDPMITGFNPTDMYAVDHIKRVLLTFPGVFSGIGEFSIHKEFVSAKISGETASLTNPAVDSILEFAGHVGLVVILHSDMDMPFAKEKAEPVYLTQMKDLLRRHPKTTIIWAHVGLGRIVHPAGYGSSEYPERSSSHIDIVEDILNDPTLSHVCFDISWDQVAKYIIAAPQTVANTAKLIDTFPNRFLFGTDVVAPQNQEFYLEIYNMYEPLWKALSPEAREKILKTNYERLFDKARKDVRDWEQAHLK